MALTDNLIAYYKMDGNSLDELTTNDLTDTAVSYVAGKLSQAGSYNGSTSFSLNSNTINQANITVAAWINIVAVPPSQGYIVGFCQGNGGVTYDKDLVINADGTIKFYCYDGGAQYSPNSAVVTPGTWYHFVGVADSSTVKMYVNGTSVGSNPCGATYTGYSGSNIMLGGNTAGYRNTQCLLDEVGFWSRALDATEVTTLYNAGAGLTYPFTVASTNQAGILTLL